MAVDNPSFLVDCGDDLSLIVLIKNRDGSPADIGGGVLSFGYARKASDPPVNRGLPSASPVLISQIENGRTFPAASITLAAGETSALQPFADWIWACRLTLGGEADTVARGGFRSVPVPL